MYLSSGACVAMIITGGSTLKYFFFYVTCSIQIINSGAMVLGVYVHGCDTVSAAQLEFYSWCFIERRPHSRRIFTFSWVVSVAKSRIPVVSYELVRDKSDIGETFQVLNAPGIIAFAFTVHNLTLFEIRVNHHFRMLRDSRLKNLGLTLTYEKST